MIRLGTSNKPFKSILQKAQDSITEEELLNLKRKMVWFKWDKKWTYVFITRRKKELKDKSVKNL